MKPSTDKMNLDEPPDPKEYPLLEGGAGKRSSPRLAVNLKSKKQKEVVTTRSAKKDKAAFVDLNIHQFVEGKSIQQQETTMADAIERNSTAPSLGSDVRDGLKAVGNGLIRVTNEAIEDGDKWQISAEEELSIAHEIGQHAVPPVDMDMCLDGEEASVTDEEEELEAGMCSEYGNRTVLNHHGQYHVTGVRTGYERTAGMVVGVREQGNFMSVVWDGNKGSRVNLNMVRFWGMGWDRTGNHDNNFILSDVCSGKVGWEGYHMGDNGQGWAAYIGVAVNGSHLLVTMPSGAAYRGMTGLVGAHYRVNKWVVDCYVADLLMGNAQNFWWVRGCWFGFLNGDQRREDLYNFCFDWLWNTPWLIRLRPKVMGLGIPYDCMLRTCLVGWCDIIWLLLDQVGITNGVASRLGGLLPGLGGGFGIFTRALWDCAWLYTRLKHHVWLWGCNSHALGGPLLCAFMCFRGEDKCGMSAAPMTISGAAWMDHLVWLHKGGGLHRAGGPVAGVRGPCFWLVGAAPNSELTVGGGPAGYFATNFCEGQAGIGLVLFVTYNY
ncbi:hypothetical protein E3N88_33217 [Mikania micrantha]|uniref:Uncharacterized protein n=1 Tax=Mikania micrantha TaxID=192012 RepID=A0A5N6MB32_9ASTR|nr:hypothetical protein E3N88_33217 [Mikania micrantha]